MPELCKNIIRDLSIKKSDTKNSYRIFLVNYAERSSFFGSFLAKRREEGKNDRAYRKKEGVKEIRDYLYR